MIFLSFSYYKWKLNTNLEIARIKETINIAFKHYAEIINNIESKLAQKDKELKLLLDPKKYNNLLKNRKFYVDIENIYQDKGNTKHDLKSQKITDTTSSAEKQGKFTKSLTSKTLGSASKG